MADALFVQAKRLLDTGFAAEALPLLERAHAAAPGDAAVARWLATALRLVDRRDEAALVLDAALVATPADAALTIARSDLSLGRGELAEALSVLGGAPSGDSAILEQRGRVLLAARAYADSVDCFERAAVSGNLSAQSGLIVARSLAEAMDTATLKAMQRGWRGPAPLAADWPAEQFAPRRTLRIGYVSRAFSYNNVAKVIAPAILHHDPERIAVTLYSTSRRRDQGSVRFRTAAAGWRAIAGLSDEDAVREIRRDRIDILVDIDGHFLSSRLRIFSLRAAPVQVSAWGYVPGPGIAGIDALLTDTTIVPRSEEHLFPEKIVRLSQAQPYDGTFRPGDGEPPPRSDGPIRFGAFHRGDKLNDAVLSLWARVLIACPGATLTLKTNLFSHIEAQRGVRAVFAGVDPARVIFEPEEPHAAYLAAYDRIDVALDPFPVNGGLVTLDGLARGVPAITCAGAGPTGRIGASILRHLGLGRFVCGTDHEYVALAGALGRDRAGLIALRCDVRRRAAAAYGQARAYAAEVEDAYRALWERCTAQQPL